MKLLAAAFWASWFLIEWCHVFGIGDQNVLIRMFWTHLISALLCSVLYFLAYAWGVEQQKKTDD